MANGSSINSSRVHKRSYALTSFAPIRSVNKKGVRKREKKYIKVLAAVERWTSPLRIDVKGMTAIAGGRTAIKKKPVRKSGSLMNTAVNKMMIEVKKT